jgi:hypothetical protein
VAAALYFALALLYFLPALLPGAHIFGTDYINVGLLLPRLHLGAHLGGAPAAVGAVRVRRGAPLLQLGEHLLSRPLDGGLLFPTRMFFPLLFIFQFGMAGVGHVPAGARAGVPAVGGVRGGAGLPVDGLMTSWVYAGHDGRIIVASWRRSSSTCLHARVRTLRLAPFAGLAATAGFASSPSRSRTPTTCSCRRRALGGVLHRAPGRGRGRRRWGKAVALGVAAVAFGFLLAAVNFIPFNDYVPVAARGHRRAGVRVLHLVLHAAAGVLGMAVPEQVGANIQDEHGSVRVPRVPGRREPLQAAHGVRGRHGPGLLVALGVYYARRNRYCLVLRRGWASSRCRWRWAATPRSTASTTRCSRG